LTNSLNDNHIDNPTKVQTNSNDRQYIDQQIKSLKATIGQIT
jgi:hypothetical protein